MLQYMYSGDYAVNLPEVSNEMATDALANGE